MVDWAERNILNRDVQLPWLIGGGNSHLCRQSDLSSMDWPRNCAVYSGRFAPKFTAAAVSLFGNGFGFCNAVEIAMWDVSSSAKASYRAPVWVWYKLIDPKQLFGQVQRKNTELWVHFCPAVWQNPNTPKIRLHPSRPGQQIYRSKLAQCGCPSTLSTHPDPQNVGPLLRGILIPVWTHIKN
jgi:hypothetical protein